MLKKHNINKYKIDGDFLEIELPKNSVVLGVKEHTDGHTYIHILSDVEEQEKEKRFFSARPGNIELLSEDGVQMLIIGIVYVDKIDTYFYIFEVFSDTGKVKIEDYEE